MITNGNFENYTEFCRELNHDYCEGNNEFLDAGIIFSLSQYLTEKLPELRDYLKRRYPSERDLAGVLARDILSVDQEDSLLLSA